MNRALETVFTDFSRHANGRNYYSYPEGSHKSNFVFRVVYECLEPIEDGRVILFFAPSAEPEPRFEAFDLDAPRPLFAKDVRNVQPGDVIEFESTEFSTPEALGFVPQNLDVFSNELFVQVLIHHDVNDPDANSRVGNTYSKPVEVRFDGDDADNVVKVVVDQVVEDTMDLTPDEFVEHVSMKSEILSEYHNQDVYMMASVVLPKDYEALKDARHFPTVYYIEGFTGTESYAKRAKGFLSSEMGQEWQAGRWPTPMIRVTLGSRFKFGHTSFADTDANGPWGTALVTEFIPFLESQYPAVPSAGGRFLHGHSSGAWSTLWLQLQFPDFFGGTWSSAPDPVDFSRFQVMNIYEAENAYWDSNGNPYPTSRSNGLVTCSNRDENLVERVYGRGNGGQWDAFFALFSPRGADGMPTPLFDKVSGDINRDVAKYWERYDICKFLQKRPDLLTTKLRGKVHVICGVEDTYYLDFACRSLQKLVGNTKSNAQDGSAVPNYVAMVPGDHTSIRSRAHYTQVYSEIAAVFKHNMKV
ncbi:hypothetical protein PR003_g5216 [Phytophthora rubi]|uniref:Uncharacterized protein n=1 Tax=Phytophthora rubi TaxID=129364 RepID=A0A6A3LAA5_9STRA|nr:hypothetical protein PR002_g14001 [Phytophthora rubi]KAE9044039.1 hypothetical protein PR001_g5515 [Phytophthora rubi]KAE9350735.1 hypothetical protein PR003_g5216 [Phytophthora rubi]